MRGPVVAALLALCAVAGLLAYGHWGRGSTPDRPGQDDPEVRDGPPAPPPPLRDVEAVARARPQEPATQDDLRAFVADCVARGAAAVPDLLTLLKNRPDVALAPRWRFRDGRPEGGYPTLRSAYLDALASIPGREAGDALREVLDLTGSLEETYQIASALAVRDEAGWVPAQRSAIGRGRAASGWMIGPWCV